MSNSSEAMAAIRKLLIPGSRDSFSPEQNSYNEAIKDCLSALKEGKMPTCVFCQTICNSDEQLEIEHRACRLKAAFPGAYHQEGAFISFDMPGIAESLGWKEPIKTKSGLRFNREKSEYRDDVWIELPIQVGNLLTAFSFTLSWEEWLRVTRILEGEKP